MFCINCGNKLKENNNFCIKCGNKINNQVFNIIKSPSLHDGVEKTKRNKKSFIESLYIVLVIISVIGYAISTYNFYQYTYENISRLISIIEIQLFFSYLIFIYLTLTFIIIYNQKSKIVFIIGIISCTILFFCQIIGNNPVILYSIMREQIYAIIILLVAAIALIILYKRKNKIVFNIGLIIGIFLILNQIISSIIYLNALRKIYF